MKCEDCLPLIEEYVDGELDERVRERVRAHLFVCADCSTEFTEFSREQEIYALYQRDLEVTPAQWNIVRARIEQERDASLHDPRRARLHEWLSALFSPGGKFRPAMVTAFLLIVIAITAGLIYLTSGNNRSELTSKPQQPRESSTPAGEQKLATSNEGNAHEGSIAQNENREKKDSNRQAAVNSSERMAKQDKTLALVKHQRSENPRAQQPTLTERVRFEEAPASGNTIVNAPDASGDFEFEIARHAEKAQLLLRSFRNARIPASSRALDVSYEKEQSRKLLYRNIALRRDAESRGDQSTAELLNTLEPILLDIAHLPDRVKPQDVRSIEQRMLKKEIVATLQVRTLVASN